MSNGIWCMVHTIVYIQCVFKNSNGICTKIIFSIRDRTVIEDVQRYSYNKRLGLALLNEVRPFKN